MTTPFIDNAEQVDVSGMSPEARATINAAFARSRRNRRVGNLRTAVNDPRYVDANIEHAADILIADMRRREQPRYLEGDGFDNLEAP